jgi:hypothetical protein
MTEPDFIQPANPSSATPPTTSAPPQQASRSAGESRPAAPEPPTGPWADYLAAARRLDAVRRAASSAVSEQTATLQAAHQELSAVRARLAPQRARLVQDLGVPEPALVPQAAERESAAQAVAGGPGAVLAALRQARGTADAADAVMLGGPRSTPATWRPVARNLLIYGPFAAVVLIVQIVLYLVAPSGSLPTYALLCGLSMPILAFGLGWVTIGFVYADPSGKVDRTPLVGIIACLTPVLLTCMGVGLLAFFR